jgi:hypothetical protein
LARFQSISATSNANINSTATTTPRMARSHAPARCHRVRARRTGVLAAGALGMSAEDGAGVVGMKKILGL